MVGVFKMNEYDWVKADTPEQAKQWYTKEHWLDRNDVDEDFEGEVPLTDTMFFSEEDVPELDIELYNFEEAEFSGHLGYRVPFWWVILQMGSTQPYVIASTEAM